MHVDLLPCPSRSMIVADELSTVSVCISIDDYSQLHSQLNLLCQQVYLDVPFVAVCCAVWLAVRGTYVCLWEVGTTHTELRRKSK